MNEDKKPEIAPVAEPTSTVEAAGPQPITKKPVAKKRRTRKKVGKKAATGKTPVRKTSSKKAPIRKTAANKTPVKKKAAKKTAVKPEERRKAKATASRGKLVDSLKKDLKEAKKTLKLAKAAANDEIAVLKDHLDASLKREQELQKIYEKKLRKMLQAGERWEKKQLTRLGKAAEKARKQLKKK